MQSQVWRKAAPKAMSWALDSVSRYRTRRHPPVLGLDLPDIWTPPSRPLFPPNYVLMCHSGHTEIRNHMRWDTVSTSALYQYKRSVSVMIWSRKGDAPIATVIDGNSIAEEIRSAIADEVSRMKDTIGKVPGLAVILVGQRKDSQTYVRNKIKACQEVGITSLMAELPEDCAEGEVLNVVSSFNDNPSVHGILVQLPLPQHMNEEKILNIVSLEKDVDGFHPLNMGNLAMRGREPLFVPCTPKGCIELLLRSGVEIMGKKAAVIGRSNIVGLPTSLLLQRHHATVTIVHAFTRNPEEITREADIVVSAVGMANLVRGDWLKPGAVVIDVGTNPVEDPSSEYGYRLTGDVCYEEALQVASAITPVPGGVGPMTIAMLLSNTLDSAKRAYRFS